MVYLIPVVAESDVLEFVLVSFSGVGRRVGRLVEAGVKGGDKGDSEIGSILNFLVNIG